MTPRVYYLKVDYGRLLNDAPDLTPAEFQAWAATVNRKATELHCGKCQTMPTETGEESAEMAYMFADGNNAFAFMQWLADETERLGALAHMSLGVLPSDYPDFGEPLKPGKYEA